MQIYVKLSIRVIKVYMFQTWSICVLVMCFSQLVTTCLTTKLDIYIFFAWRKNIRKIKLN